MVTTTTKRLFPALLALAILVGNPSVGSATLIVNGAIVNDPLFFHANLTWQNPSVFDTLDLSPMNTPWDVTVGASGISQFALIVGQHAVGPHPGDDPFGGNLQLLFNLSPGFGSDSQTVTAQHPGAHFDRLTVTITPDIQGVSSIIDITAAHEFIPEPGTLSLGGIGAFLLYFTRRRFARE